jgi:hypothetical protein
MVEIRGLLACLLLACAACGSEPPQPAAEPECAAFEFSDRGDVRAFVVGHKQSLDDLVSYESYERSFRRHVEAIAPCLSASRPNLVVFPENAALGALLIGSRAENARRQDKSIDAFTQVFVGYQQSVGWYAAKYPGLSINRWLLLALTDVGWRAFDETFGGIARDFGVWVMSSADLAPAEKSSDPLLVENLGDPDLSDQKEVWVASGPDTFNSAYLFEPGGAIFGRVDKVFLTDPEENDLDLANGSFAALATLDTPFAKLGVATSRDAFYPPFMQRLEDLDAELVVQPEAFSGWALGELPVEWYPDVFTSSAWTHQQKYRTFRHNLTPQYTGNFFELVFDGQVHVTERARPGQGQAAYIGQDPIPGWLAIGPWVVPDDRSLPVAQRREQLLQIGEELLPGSGSPRENAYVDSMIALDLDLTARSVEVERDATKPESRAIDPGGQGHQRSADVADSGRGSIVVWQDARGGLPRVHFATSSDGTSFELGGEITPGGAGAQSRPAVCIAPDGRVAVVWQEGRPERVMAALAPAIGQAFAAPSALPASGGPQWEPDCAFSASGELTVLFSELGSGIPRLVFTTRGSTESGFAALLPVDETSVEEPRVDGTQIQPALSSDGSVAVWLDYRDHSWDVYAARREGAAFGTSQRIDGAGPERWERLCGEPRVEALGEEVIAAWTDLRERRAHPDIAFSTSSDGGRTWSPAGRVPGGPGSEPSRTQGGGAMPRYRPAIAMSASGAELFFQDLAPEKSGISRSRISRGVAGAAERFDDTAAAAVSLTRPRAAGSLVIWEDDRDGSYRIYASRSK